MQRFCLQFYCPERGDRYCCADCYLRRDCPNPCLNHPSRCRLENRDGKQRNRAVGSVRHTGILKAGYTGPKKTS